MVKTGKVRADTTVVSANVEYPTDSGLLARAVTRIAGTGAADQGGRRGDPHPVRDRRRAAGRRARRSEPSCKLRGAQQRTRPRQRCCG